MKRKLLLVVALLVSTLVVPALADNVDLETAERAAMDFVCSRNASGQFRSAMPRQLWAHTEPSRVDPRQAAYYIVNTDKGFVIVAGDDRARTILAYSDNPLTDIDDLPPGALYWLDLYRQQIEALQTHPDLSVSPQRLRTSLYHPSESISPLLQSQWSQGNPFNRNCPKVGSSTCYAGCSAVALAQVMRYWQYPARSDTLPSYTTRTLEINVPALEGTTFDWSNMLDTYPILGGYSTDQRDAIAALMRYVGQAMNMDYKSQGSDASEYDILNAIRFFGFDKTACFVEKSSIEGEDYYADNIWSAMLWNELKMGRPVVYCAYTMEEDSTLMGHAFNVDGYDAVDDTYHVNYGYRGSGDGYYALNAFVLSGYQFDIGQLMFLNVMPARPEPVLWVNKEELEMSCLVGETVTQQVIVAGSDLVSGITAVLDDPDGAFTMTVSQQMATVSIYTVTFAPQQSGSHSASLTISSQDAQDVVVIINGNATLPVTNPVMLPADSEAVSTSSFRADWSDETPDSLVVEYVLEVASSSEFDANDSCYTVITGITDTCCVVDSLAAGGTYYYRVRALYVDGSESEWSNVETVTLPEPPLPLTDPVMQSADSEAVSTSSFRADWTDETPDSLVVEYILEVASSSDFDTTDSCYTVITGITDTCYVVDNLAAGGTYYYRVKALYVDGSESGWSNVETVTLPEPPLPLTDPVMLPADSEAVSTSSFRADWADETPDSLVVEYVLEVASTSEFDANDSCYTVITGITDTCCVVDSLAAGGTYYYRVKALYVDDSESGWSNVETVTLPEPPLPLTDPVMQPADSEAVSTSSFRADWTDETPDSLVVEYVLEVASSAEFDPNDSCYTEITGITDTCYVVDSLAAGGTYYYRVKALYVDGSESEWSNVETVTLPEPPLPLTDPVMQPADSEAVSSSSFRADWSDETPDSLIVEYVLEVASSADFDANDSCYTVITGITDTCYVVDSLAAGGTYYYRVKALYIDGSESEWSNVETVTLPEPPLPLTDPVMQPADSEAVSTTSFRADWADETPDSLVVEYVLEVASTSDFDTTDSCYTVITGITNTCYVVDSLAGGGTYYYRVKALYVDGTESEWSNVETVTLPEPPLPLTDPVMQSADSEAVSTSSFRAEWSDETPDSLVVEYILEVASSAEFDTTDSCYTVITGITDTCYVVDSLAGGGTYYYRVKALYVDGSESGWSNVETVTLPEPPLPLTDPVMQPADSASVSETSFVAEWSDETPDSLVVEYILEVASSAEFDANDSCYTVITGITDTCCVVDSLAAGGTYYYRVKALYVDGSESGWSNVETVTLPEPPLPLTDPVMQSADSEAVSTSSFRADWTDETPDSLVVEYILEVASSAEFDPNDSCYTVITGITDTCYVVDSLAAGGTYYYRVKALYVDGSESEWSNVETVTLPEPPLPLTDPVMQPADSEAVSTTSFRADWSDVTPDSLVVEYVLEVASTSDFDTNDSCYTVITGITDTCYVVDSLTAGGTYYYRVKALYIDGTESEWSNVETVTLPEPQHGYQRGDANHDGMVNINDVTCMIDALLTPEVEACPICADVDLDGEFNINDLTALIDMILTSNTSQGK